jgi:preprotein translocase subunit SecY
MGSGLPANIFDLGIGPKINAQWTIGLLMFFKVGGLKKELEELQKSGREVPPSTAASVHESVACMKVFVALKGR